MLVDDLLPAPAASTTPGAPDSESAQPVVVGLNGAEQFPYDRFLSLVVRAGLCFPAFASRLPNGTYIADSPIHLEPLPANAELGRGALRFMVDQKDIRAPTPVDRRLVMVEWKEPAWHQQPRGIIWRVATPDEFDSARDSLTWLISALRTPGAASLDSAFPDELVMNWRDPVQRTIAIPALWDWLATAVSEVRERFRQETARIEAERQAVMEERRSLEPVRVFANAIGLSNDLPVATAEASELPSLDEVDHAIGDVGTPLVRRSAIVASLVGVLGGSLLLLDGSVGTGKTTLANRIAEAAGGRSVVVPVRPAWIEPADLLGYYDSFNRAFRPGPLIEALQTAAEDRMFGFVLDELNLARIENYGADLLSRIEQVAASRGGAQQLPGIPVWSAAEYSALREEFSHLSQVPDPTAEDRRRLARLKASLQYLPDLYLPDGTVFVGTLNTDDTTFDLSPKVIDRSFGIAFPIVQAGQGTLGETLTSAISLRRLRREVVGLRGTEPVMSLQTVMSEASLSRGNMAILGVPYSHRYQRDLELFAATAMALRCDPREVPTMFVFSRVLPRIRFFKRENRTQVALVELARLEQGVSRFSEDEAWISLLRRLSRQCNEERETIVRFWRSELA